MLAEPPIPVNHPKKNAWASHSSCRLGSLQVGPRSWTTSPDWTTARRPRRRSMRWFDTRPPRDMVVVFIPGNHAIVAPGPAVGGAGYGCFDKGFADVVVGVGGQTKQAIGLRRRSATQGR